MVTFELNENAALTDDEKELLAEARKKPILYDEDCPELTEDMQKSFAEARKAKPYRGQAITLYVSSATLAKVKTMGTDYIAILEKLLDKAVDEYSALG